MNNTLTTLYVLDFAEKGYVIVYYYTLKIAYRIMNPQFLNYDR